MHNQPQNPSLTSSLLCANLDVLRSMQIQTEDEVSVSNRPKSFRTPSPVKMLSSFLSGNTKESNNTSKPSHIAGLGNIPSMPPPSRPDSRPTSSDSLKSSTFDTNASKISLVGISAAERPPNPLTGLEESFAAYVLALRSRKGNVVGRVLRARVAADEIVVNELYNAILEDPSNLQVAAEVPVDVLFVAFEKFMRVAWKEQMGPLISPQTLQLIQNRLDMLSPSEFEEVFVVTLSEMAPQNKRALSAVVKLLGDLLDASGNDGDRGALTAAFAELLTEQGDPLSHIPLLDRVVDNYDALFKELAGSGPGTSAYNSITSLNRARSVNTGSLSSNTSSIRRKFGFGLSRENSKHDKTEGEGKVSSLIRSLSKNKHAGDEDSQATAWSRGALARSNSTDAATRLGLMTTSRPPSRERPNIVNAFNMGSYSSRPGSSHNNVPTLGTIGEVPVVAPRKKRRSSLSDLHAVQAANMSSGWSSPVSQRRPNLLLTQGHQPSISIGTVSPSKSPSNLLLDRASPSRLPTPSVATKGSDSPGNRSTLTERAVNRGSEEQKLNSTSPTKRSELQSNIPAPNHGLRERSPSLHAADALQKRSQHSTQKMQKLKLQSPQKLRERLEAEKKKSNTTSGSLEAELSKIGDELSVLDLSAGKTPSGTITRARSGTVSKHADVVALRSRVKTLETSVSSLHTETASRMTAVEASLNSTLAASERKAREMDQLYRSANAENEALYERFNTELGKILSRIKAGPDQSNEELKRLLKESQEEGAKLRRDNARLKRECVNLRSFVKGAD